MSFIDNTYFKGAIKLSSADTSGDYSDDFEATIEEVEKNTLIELLGYDLYKAFIDGLEETTVAQKWLDLRDGKEYTTEDSEGRTVTIKWNGFQNTQCISPLAYFIYYDWQVNNYTQNTTTGENKQASQNSTPGGIADINRKLINAYNKGVDLYGVDVECLIGVNAILRSRRYQRELLTKQNPLIGYYAEKLKPTAYNFIYAMNELDETTYPNWNFTEKKKLNLYGI